MAKPLDPKKIESARQFSSRAERREQRRKLMQDEIAENQRSMNTPPETVPLDRTNGALRPLKWCMVTAVMVH